MRPHPFYLLEGHGCRVTDVDGVLFTDRPLQSNRDVDQVAEARMEGLFRAALDAGVLLHTTGLGCLSTPMGEDEVEEIAATVAHALRTVSRP